MPDTYNEISSLFSRALELDRQSQSARESNNIELAQEIYEELMTVIIPKAEALVALNNGHNAFANFALGVVFRILHLYEDAIFYFKQSLLIAPDVDNTLLEITQCLALSGNLIAAEEYARRAVQVAPDSAATWGNLAMVLIQNKKREESFDAINKAVKLDPHDSKNRYILENFHGYFR